MSNLTIQDGKFDDIFPTQAPMNEPMHLDLDQPALNFITEDDRMRQYIHTYFPQVSIDNSQMTVKMMYDYLSNGGKLVSKKVKETRIQRQMIIHGKVVTLNEPWNTYHELVKKEKYGKLNLKETKDLFAMQAYLLKPEDRPIVLREMKMNRIYREMTKDSPITQAKRILESKKAQPTTHF